MVFTLFINLYDKNWQFISMEYDYFFIRLEKILSSYSQEDYTILVQKQYFQQLTIFFILIFTHLSTITYRQFHQGPVLSRPIGLSAFQLNLRNLDCILLGNTVILIVPRCTPLPILGALIHSCDWINFYTFPGKPVLSFWQRCGSPDIQSVP